MKVFGIRSVQLRVETTQAWKDAGMSFFRRGVDNSYMANIVSSWLSGSETGVLEPVAILNMGKTAVSFADYPNLERIVWNDGENIRPLVWPGTSARLLDGLMPPKPESFPADIWIKAPGMAGRGKFRKQVDRPMALPREWDWQAHVDGQEYRVVTVGHRVVQNLERFGRNGEREYRWIRMSDVPERVKKLAREAARRVPGRNVIGWDIVDTGSEAYIFEGNTCPGVSKETAARVIKEMTRQMEEAQ